jgi:putative pyruvate formate lyase activating enzyme
MFIPSYINLYKTGELKKRIKRAEEILKNCTLCPRKCKVDRTKNEKGYCKSGYLPRVSSFNPHFGEEAPLVGKNGSGTIFFSGCNLLCVFCQNYEISHLNEGEEVTFENLAKMMLYLQNIGCHNINFVTPTHFILPILKSLEIAISSGFSLPIVYNCGGYENLETLKLLEGVVDIYMPDIKYSDSSVSKEYSNAEDYFEVAKKAVKEMHRQVGDLLINSQGIAERGLLIRHLVLPQNRAGTKEIMKFIAEEISPYTYINIMDQYYPCYLASKFPQINRRITSEEYKQAIETALSFGLRRIDERKRIFILRW